ncbi:MAG: glucose-6-phosphate isomerase [Planctomycetaceae bacterium]|nr:glucose-6-phosphate isomerase [Planctomycetaceae bacterium]
MSQSKLISFDPRGVFFEPHGIKAQQFDDMATELTNVRAAMLNEDLQQFESGQIPDERQPLDAGFMELPERMLEAYRTDRQSSELGRILETAQRIQQSVDRVVVLGIGGSYMGARALMESCCQPYYNEYSRAERGGRPKIYYEGNNVDNDWSQGLLNLLRSQNDDMPWSIVVISKSGGTLETAAAFRQFLHALQSEVGTERLPELVVPVTGKAGKLAELSDAIGCQSRFAVPDGVGGRFSVFSPVGLVPAALMGIDIIALLEGAAAMNDHFRQAEFGKNVVLDFVAVNHLLEREQGCHTRILSAWTKSLESLGFWYDQLLAESLGKREQGALPLTTVNTRDLHSRAQQHQEGRRDKVVNNLVLDSWRYDPLPVGHSVWNQDGLNDLSDRTLPEIMDAAFRGTNLAYREDQRPTTTLRLPGCNESSMGQLMQMLMLTTVVEGRLMNINPYGQPGVEKYKKNMNRLLRESSRP